MNERDHFLAYFKILCEREAINESLLKRVNWKENHGIVYIVYYIHSTIRAVTLESIIWSHPLESYEFDSALSTRNLFTDTI